MDGGVGLFAGQANSGMAQDTRRNSSLENSSYLSETLALHKKEFRVSEFPDSRVATIRLEEDNTVIIPQLCIERK